MNIDHIDEPNPTAPKLPSKLKGGEPDPITAELTESSRIHKIPPFFIPWWRR